MKCYKNRYDDANGAFNNAQRIGDTAKQLVNHFLKAKEPVSYQNQDSSRNFKIQQMSKIDSEDEPDNSFSMGGDVELKRVHTEGNERTQYDQKNRFDNNTVDIVENRNSSLKDDTVPDRESSYKSDFEETNEMPDGISSTMPEEIFELKDVIFKKYLRLDNTRFKFVVADMKNYCCAVIFLFNKPRKIMQKLFVNYQD